MIPFSELIVEETGVFVANGNDNIANWKICFVEQTNRFFEAFFLQQAAERHATQLANALGKIGDAQIQLSRKLAERSSAKIGA